MKKAEFIAAVESGIPVIRVEYRASQAREIKLRDSTSGKTLSANILTHTVENAYGAIRISERQDENFRPETYKSPWKKGQMVYVLIASMQEQKGLLSIQGNLLPCEEVEEVAGSGPGQSPKPK